MMTLKRRSKGGSVWTASNAYCVVGYNVRVVRLDSSQELTLFIGTLVSVSSQLSEATVAVKVVDIEGQYNVSEEHVWRCVREALVHVDKTVWPLLSAVASPVERVFLLKERGELVERLAALEPGSRVDVIGRGSGDPPLAPATLRFKGPIPKKGPGIYFGVELLEPSCEGDTDGTFGSQRLFTCGPGRGLFLTIDCLSLDGVGCPGPAHPSGGVEMLPNSSTKGTTAAVPTVQQLRDKFEKLHKPFHSTGHNHKNGGACECSTSSLKVGDQVVWLSDMGPVQGVVRWLTCYHSNHLQVSVHFNEPVRNSYLGKNESTTTTVVPAAELVKVADFYGLSESDLGTSCGGAGNSGSSGTAGQSETGALPPHDLISFTPPHSVADDVSSSGSSEAGSGYYDSPGAGASGGSGLGLADDEPEDDEVRSLGVGSLVEVRVGARTEPHYGVIRWIGHVSGDKVGRTVAGVEMEEDQAGLGDGTFNGRRYFQCKPGRSLFVNLNQCRKDPRFQDIPPPPKMPLNPEDFGSVESPVIEGVVPPISREGDISCLCAKYRGIQGHHNSCYLDATLFSMFTFTSVFDSLLYRPATPSDIAQYDQVQRVLRDEIVNPLRENLYVRADRVMKLRQLMDRLSSVSGLTTEEKDPEEFLTSLVAQILRAEPFLKLSSGQEAYHYQLFVEKDESLRFPTVQQLFEQSFLASEIKLKEVPSCLIIQMPRFGKSYKMYPRILPSQLLDVTDVIEHSPRQCTVCGKLAELECKQCLDECDVGLQSVSFCAPCLETVHGHDKRRHHSWRPLTVPPEFAALQDHCVIPRLYMHLFAVVCIETSHYVTFVKCGSGAQAPWCFFDSMADRKGEQNGYNIPEVVACPNLPYWLSECGAHMLEQITDERQLPEHAKRLLCDPYMCMYQSSEVMMYR